MIKIKRLLIVISVISFFAVFLTSCSEDGVMDSGGTSGGGTPPPPNMNNVLASDSIAVSPYLQND